MGAWIEAELVHDDDNTESNGGIAYLNSDRSVVCDGDKHLFTQIISENEEALRKKYARSK